MQCLLQPNKYSQFECEDIINVRPGLQAYKDIGHPMEQWKLCMPVSTIGSMPFGQGIGNSSTHDTSQ